jgi:hypothetical protein
MFAKDVYVKLISLTNFATGKKFLNFAVNFSNILDPGFEMVNIDPCSAKKNPKHTGKMNSRIVKNLGVPYIVHWYRTCTATKFHSCQNWNG